MKKKIKIVGPVIIFHMVILFMGFSTKEPEVKEEIKIPIRTAMNFAPKPEPIVAPPKEISKEEVKEKPVEPPKEIVKSTPKKPEKKPIEKLVEKKVEKVHENAQIEAEQIESPISDTTEEIAETTTTSTATPQELYNYRGDAYVANSSEGIEYQILREVDPDYPPRLKNMLGRDEITIKTKFLVDKNGKVSKVEFIGENNRLLQQEVEKALKRWIFKPMTYKDKPLEVYFYKEFKFR